MAVGKVAVVADRLKSNVQLRVRIVAYARNDSNEVDFETDLKGLMISELKRAHGIAPSRIVSEILLNGDAGTVARKALECVIEKPK